MANHRTAGVVCVVVGILWFAVFPAFMGFMLFMEGSVEPAGPGQATWRQWRALEDLLIAPAWLAYGTTLWLFATSFLGILMIASGVQILSGKAPAQTWAIPTVLGGIALCATGLLCHWTLVMPALVASPNPAVRQAAADLSLGALVTLGFGLMTMVVALVTVFSTGRTRGSSSNGAPPWRQPAMPRP